MENSAEPSSSLSFTSPSWVSNGSICNNNNIPSSGLDTGLNLEIVTLTKLSSNLEQLLIDSGSDYSDAEIIVENIPIPVHRCILAARSTFFDELFKKEKGVSERDGKPKYSMSELLSYGKVGYEAFIIFLNYLYTGKLKPFPMEVSTCVDNQCAHDACRPAIDFVVQLMYASSIFQVAELASLFQRRLQHFIGKALVEDVLSILLVAYHCKANNLITPCVERVAKSDLDAVSIEKELPYGISENIKLLRTQPNLDPLYQKRVKRIHKALDSDDVELVKLLLSESNITLDEAYALHYATMYCDPKVVSEVLALNCANINLQNDRGYSVIHIAAMRKEPSIIVGLLTKGARASEMTLDGWSAVRICRRLTRPKDYNAKTEQGQEANKDRICIDVLEREMWRNPTVGDASMSSLMIADDLHMKLLYLENRVAFARILFPAEAKLAMEIAQAETTFEFRGRLASKNSSGDLRQVDLNETPDMQKKRLHSRMEALSKTVEMGRRYFPLCSQVLDKLVEDDMPDFETGTSEEKKIKMTRFKELKEDVDKAFRKDKAQLQRSGFSPSSSSIKQNGNYNKVRKL